MCKFCGRSDISFQDNNELSESLKREKENADYGLLWQGPLLKDNHEIEYDPETQYQFLNDIKDEGNIHPNLLEQARLNMNFGLYQVLPGKKDSGNLKTRLLQDGEKYSIKAGDVFQIRGYDLASMTLVYDGTGWIVMDVLTTSERAEAAWRTIVKAHFETAVIRTVVYSHSHIDHYGGIGGLKDYFDKECVILAPDGFTKHAVSENIYVGTAMTRRAIYQYGSNLAINEEGCVDCGLGKAVSKGTNTILVPNWEIGVGNYRKDKGYCVYDATDRTVLTPKAKIPQGHLMLQLQFTPGTEAPAEMNVYLPEQKILFIAENCAGTLHNTLTPRGAEVRDPLAWAGFLDETLVVFPHLETVCSAHNWPHFGRKDSVHFIEIQRDMYRYLNNATLHLVNLGYTIDEVGRMVSGEDGSMPLPKAFAGEWCCHGFYGTYNHDAKAVYQRYMGWYDGNPAHLNRHTPVDRATRYVNAFGAKELYNEAERAESEGDYAWAAELLDYLLNAQGGTSAFEKVRDDAKALYPEVLREMGYASESPSWRNMYLTGAQEIEQETGSDTQSEAPHLSFPDDTVEAMTLEMILQYLGIMLDSRSFSAAFPKEHLTMQIAVTADDGSSEYANVAVDASRGVLHYRIVSSEMELDKFPKINVRGEKLMFFRAFVDQDMDKMKIIVNPNEIKIAENFIKSLTQFPLNFPIMTPRKQYGAKI